MPNTHSAEKTAIQSRRRAERLLPYKTRMKSSMKKIITAASAGRKDDVQKMLAEAYKSIDMATKKRIIHRNSASRKKSRLARVVAAMK